MGFVEYSNKERAMQPEGPSDRKIFSLLGTIVGLLSLLTLYTQCIISSPKPKTKKASTSESTNNTTNNNQNNNNNNNNNNNSNNNNNNNSTDGEMFFTNTVIPMFQQQCMLCHTEPQNFPPLPGPLSIYDYNAMRAMVMNGTTAASNQLINKLQANPSHAGGNRCPSGITDPVCDLVVQWWQRENPGNNNNNNNNNDPAGSILAVSPTGKVTGWAADPLDTNSAVEVRFYVGGEMGTGTFVGSVMADDPGFNGGYPGQHAYTFYIPINYRDGATHQLYAYVTNGQIDVALMGSPWTFNAYTSTVEGFNYYTNTVRPLLMAQCSACHAIIYDVHFSSLLNPTPAGGGTATNNEMINMPSGSHNGENHPGGNICGSKFNSPCSEIQTWWNLELGN